MQRLMIGPCLFAALALAANGGGGLCAAEPDPIKAKLAAAHTAYDQEIDKFKVLVLEHFDAKEKAARLAGSKPVLDALKLERKLFEEKGELPKYLSPLTKAKPDAAQKALRIAYESAIADCVREKKDDLANEIEAKRDEVFYGVKPKSEAVPAPKKEVVAAPPPDKRTVWVHPEGYFMRGQGKDWFEKAESGNRGEYFFEVSRNKEFVHMKKMNGQAIRIYATRVDYDGDANGNYKTIFRGEWTK